MAVLVTGGAGYIGSHTAVALHEAGREVVLIDNSTTARPQPSMRSVPHDLRHGLSRG